MSENLETIIVTAAEIITGSIEEKQKIEEIEETKFEGVEEKPVKKKRATKKTTISDTIIISDKEVTEIIENKTEIGSDSNNSVEIAILELKNEISSLKNNFITELAKLVNIIAEKDLAIKCHTELVQRLIHERLTYEPSLIKDTSAEPGPGPGPGPSIEQKKKVKITKYDETKTKIYGHTYDYNPLIKQINGRTFVSEEKEKFWLIPTLLKSDLIKLFNDNKVEFEEI